MKFIVVQLLTGEKEQMSRCAVVRHTCNPSHEINK